MQLRLVAGFRAPCLVFEPALQLTCHVLGLITTANTARVLKYLSLNARDYACDETLPPAYFRSAPSHALPGPTAPRVYRQLPRRLSGPRAAATVQSALLANLLKTFHHDLSRCGPREEIFTFLSTATRCITVPPARLQLRMGPLPLESSLTLVVRAPHEL